MTALLPCPFCGCMPKLETKHKTIIGLFYFYKCPNCEVSGGLGYDKNEAMNLWNTRPLESTLRAENAKLREALGKIEHGKYIETINGVDYIRDYSMPEAQVIAQEALK